MAPPGSSRLRFFALVARTVVVGAVTAMLVAGGLGAVSAPAAARAQPATLTWRSCAGAAAECARLTVPLDDTNPADVRTIDLALTRVPARDPDRRIGSLLVNPGGPGAPGADFASGIASILPDDVQDRFDIVGWDPRGTGASAGIDCTDDLDPLYALDWDPDTDAERVALEDANRAFVAECVASAGDLLSFISSDRTARDMDRIRAALGDEQLSYVGFSYGTYLGAQYAAQFPDRVRALVLDGAVDPALDATAVQVEQAEAFERSLELFLDDCAKRTACAFHRGPGAGTAYDELRARLDDEGIPAGDDRRLNGTLFDTGIAQILYDGKASWPALDAALAAAAEGDGSELLSYADLYTDRADDGTYGDVQDSFLAIGCADGPPLGGIEGLRAIEAKAKAKAPRLGPSIVNNSMACAFWPFEAPAPRPLHAPDADPILVLGTRNDPATPLAWAKGLTEQLGSATLLTVGGAHHTAFASGNACVDLVVQRYLVDLRTPRDGKRC
ncbi:MAG: alpha/beta hydrolase [Acidimicrobiia bacterium]